MWNAENLEATTPPRLTRSPPPPLALPPNTQALIQMQIRRQILK